MKRFLEVLARFVGFLLAAAAGVTIVGRAALYVMRETSFSAPTKGITVGLAHIAGLVLGGVLGLRLLQDRDPGQRP